MPGSSTPIDYFSDVKQRLVSKGFHTKDNVTFGNQTFKCMAKKTGFQLQHVALAETFFVFGEFSSIGPASLTEFSQKCLKLATRSKVIPLPYVLFNIAICFSVALVNEVDDKTKQYIVNSTPPWHLMDFEIPVIYDVSNKGIYYSEMKPKMGYLFYDRFHETIRSVL